MIIINNLICYDKDIIDRVLWLDYKKDIGVFIDIKTNKFPYFKKISDVEDDIKTERAFLLLEDPVALITNESSIPKKHIEKRNEIWNMIKDIVEVEPDIYETTNRRKYIVNICNKYDIHENSLTRYIKRYWQRGKNKNALLPDYYLCGAKGKSRGGGKAKRGRPRKYIEVIGEGININDEIKKVFRIAINKYYYNSSQKSLTLTYELMLKEFFNTEMKVKDNSLIPIIKPYGEIPTLNQFRYWFDKEKNLKREISTRKSSKKYEQKYRGVVGESTGEAMGPGFFEIDATVGDIYLVSRYNRDWIIGRPVIYFVIDRFSRMIVGLYVGLEGPSWAGAMMALCNAASDKVSFCKEYGIDIEEDKWPASVLPEILIADRGELEGSKIDSLINTFNIKVQNTPPFRADWKGIVEKYFNLTNIRTKALLPGVINAEARERGDRDYRLDAKLDIYQFTQIIIKSVLYHNNANYLNNYNREKMMIEDDIEVIPVNLWNWGIKNRSGRLKHIPEEIVKLNLMPIDKATVSAQGIKFKGMLYSSKKSLEQRWFEQARNNGSWKVEIRYDPRKMDYIYIQDDSRFNFDKCYLLEHQKKYKDKSIEEIEYLIEYERLKNKEYLEEKIQSKVDLISEIETIVEEAEKQTIEEQSNKGSKRSRLKNIRSNRNTEKLLNRKEESFELGKREDINESKVISILQNEREDTDGDNQVSLLLKKQKEALEKIHGK